MRYVSIDCETTGLNPDTCQVVEFGAVLEDTSKYLTTNVNDLPSFHAYIEYETYSGEPYALSMHPTIFRRIAEKKENYQYLKPEELGVKFLIWLLTYEIINKEGDPITAAGKNFSSFDRNFLLKIPKFSPPIKFHHRTLDPAVLYWNPSSDKQIPNLKECLERANINKPVLHTAVDDARLVIEILRKKYHLLEWKLV